MLNDNKEFNNIIKELKELDDNTDIKLSIKDFTKAALLQRARTITKKQIFNFTFKYLSNAETSFPIDFNTIVPIAKNKLVIIDNNNVNINKIHINIDVASIKSLTTILQLLPYGVAYVERLEKNTNLYYINDELKPTKDTIFFVKVPLNYSKSNIKYNAKKFNVATQMVRDNVDFKLVKIIGCVENASNFIKAIELYHKQSSTILKVNEPIKKISKVNPISFEIAFVQKEWCNKNAVAAFILTQMPDVDIEFKEGNNSSYYIVVLTGTLEEREILINQFNKPHKCLSKSNV